MWGYFVYSCRTSKIVTDADLKFLMEILDEKLNENDKWEDVIDKRNHHLYYNAKCSKPKVTDFVFKPECSYSLIVLLVAFVVKYQFACTHNNFLCRTS